MYVIRRSSHNPLIAPANDRQWEEWESLYKISALMGNSPDVCRRHYAALIPEQMRDTVEFTRPVVSSVNGMDATQALIEELLEKLKMAQAGAAVEARPNLRLVR